MSSITFVKPSQYGEQQHLSVLPKAKQILYNSIKKSIEMLEDSPTDALLGRMCSMHRVSEIDLLTNYSLFEKSLRQTLYDGADIILDFLKEVMLQHSTTKSPSLTIDDIMAEINSSSKQNLMLKMKLEDPALFKSRFT
jgi:hypothetical protein